jgi:hypothetical protein
MLMGILRLFDCVPVAWLVCPWMIAGKSIPVEKKIAGESEKRDVRCLQ